MNENPVRWFEIYVQEMARAKSFYESVLGVKLEALNSPGVEMFAFPMQMGQGGASGSLVRMEGMPSGGNSTLVYFGCEDCAVEAARAVKPAAASAAKSSRLANTVSVPWPWIPRATSSVCIR
jgi:predicted enzyme related to lactoylglutathione lyase